MSIELLIPFALATLIFTITPGPGSLYCAAQSLAGGTRSGLKAALGLHLGGYVHVAAASLGLSFLFAAAPVLFTVFKIAGAGILIWMGLSLIRSRLSGTEPEAQEGQSSSLAKSILVAILNPPSALFFVAFLPQFVSPEGALPLALQFLILGTITNVAFSASDIFYALTAGELRARLARSARIQTWVQRVGGGLLIGLGLKLLMTRNAAP